VPDKLKTGGRRVGIFPNLTRRAAGP
jgi:hypothetical protein